MNFNILKLYLLFYDLKTKSHPNKCSNKCNLLYISRKIYLIVCICAFKSVLKNLSTIT